MRQLQEKSSAFLVCWNVYKATMANSVDPDQTAPPGAGLENSSRPLVFTSASGCRASENLIFLMKFNFFPIYAIIFCDAGQVPISIYF